MNLAMIFVLFFIFVFFVTSRGNIEPFSSDGWFLRAYPNDGALNCKGQLSIK